MRCIGSIRKECRDRDWHIGLFSSCNRTSENFVFCSLQETLHKILHRAFTVTAYWGVSALKRTPNVENLKSKNITHDSQCAIQMYYYNMLGTGVLAKKIYHLGQRLQENLLVSLSSPLTSISRKQWQTKYQQIEVIHFFIQTQITHPVELSHRRWRFHSEILLH
jgi:hypothetical protein